MYLDIKELSQYLSIKRCILYAWVAQGKRSHVNIHDLIRFQNEKMDARVESFQKEKLKVVPSLSFTGKDYKDIDRLVWGVEGNL